MLCAANAGSRELDGSLRGQACYLIRVLQKERAKGKKPNRGVVPSITTALTRGKNRNLSSRSLLRTLLFLAANSLREFNRLRYTGGELQIRLAGRSGNADRNQRGLRLGAATLIASDYSRISVIAAFRERIRFRRHRPGRCATFQGGRDGPD